MPQVSVKRQTPVYMAEAVRYDQCGNSSQHSEVLHKRAEHCPDSAFRDKGQEQAEIHRQTAELKGEKPPVVISVIYDII